MGNHDPVLLVIALPDLAKRIAKVLEGEANYIVRTLADGKELRHVVHAHQPDILLLDYRCGANRFRSIDEVPAIVDRTASLPTVIMILPEFGPLIEREAARLNCYDVVNESDPEFLVDLSDAVSTAIRDWRHRKPEPRRKEKEDLH